MTAPRDSATIARGEYIFKYQAHCWGCHATGNMGADSPPSGGGLFDLRDAGPGFGIWRSRNLTPDVETGIGGWTDGEIVQAMREGIRKDRTAMFPLMPVDWYYGISDADALAIVAYLRSIPPVSNRVPPQEPSIFAKALFAFGVMKPKERIAEPVIAPPKGVTVEYGKYVATHVAACFECHAPRNLSNGQFYPDSIGGGSVFPFGSGEKDGVGAVFQSFARNITSDKATGIGNWTEAQFLSALTVGMRPDGTVLYPSMPYSYFKFCTEEDLRAIYLYLESMPAVKRTVPPTEASAAYLAARGADRGKLLFAGRCLTCHGGEGAGSHPTKVKLAEVASSLSDADLKEMIRTGDTNLKMPSFGQTLSAEELNDLVAYVRTWKTQ
jgi:mono/diheme cytochrome c family protein